MHYATLTAFRINQLPRIPKNLCALRVLCARQRRFYHLHASLRRLHRRSRAHAMTLGKNYSAIYTNLVYSSYTAHHSTILHWTCVIFIIKRTIAYEYPHQFALVHCAIHLDDTIILCTRWTDIFVWGLRTCDSQLCDELASRCHEFARPRRNPCQRVLFFGSTTPDDFHHHIGNYQHPVASGDSWEYGQ